MALLGDSKITKLLFDRAQEPQRIWGQDGEIASHDAGITEVIRDKERFKEAFYNLSERGALRLRHASADDGYVSIDRFVLLRIANQRSSAHHVQIHNRPNR